jgi:hypothetical protein
VFFAKFKLFLLGVVLSVSGCATSDPALWPPTPGTPTKEIYVSLDTWHAMIGFQQGSILAQKYSGNTHQAPLSSLQPGRFEEWGYAERAWYLEGQQGITGVLRALFWPSEGVVEVAEYDHLWADRTPQPPSDLFKFELSEEGYTRLRTHLQSTRESSNPVKTYSRSNFYRATNSYHVFHHCHQYVARALQKAGLPVSTVWAITRTGLASQLQEVQESGDESEEK